MKNIAMLGGALLITYFGAGPMSIDSMIDRRKPLVTTEKSVVLQEQSRKVA